jgi:spermidine synthase
VVLRLRSEPDHDIYELVVNGAFAMDSAETTTEAELGRIAAADRPSGRRILVGGLGLGYTVAEICRFAVASIHVVEIEECIVDWARSGLTPTLAAVAGDPRVRLRVADIASVLADPGPEMAADLGWDAIVLDVDNGPDFLIHDRNAALYRRDMLSAAASRLSSGGLLAIWCQGPAPDLEATLRSLDGLTELRTYEIRRAQRRLTYVIYTFTRPPTTGSVLRPE